MKIKTIYCSLRQVAPSSVNSSSHLVSQEYLQPKIDKKYENSASTKKTIFLWGKETIYLSEQNLKRPYGVQVDFHLITH